MVGFIMLLNEKGQASRMSVINLILWVLHTLICKKDASIGGLEVKMPEIFCFIISFLDIRLAPHANWKWFIIRRKLVLLEYVIVSTR